MRTALLGLLGLALAALLAFFVLHGLTPDPYDPVAAARQAAQVAELARQADNAERLAWLDLAVAALLKVIPIVALICGLAYLAGLGRLHLLRLRHERRPDARGLLPVERHQLGGVAPQALGAFHAARQLEAGRALVPHTLTYAPHSAYRNDAAAPALLPAALAGAVAVPTFAELLDAGRIGKGNPMLLGYDEGGRPVEGSWLDLYSCAVGGLSGSGKSWTATYLAAQAALFGAQLVILDPHASNTESLASRLAPMRGAYICAPAESPREMLAAVELVAAELDRRKAGARGPGLLFICDEFSALQRGALAEPLAALVEALGQEGRKLGLYAMVCGQVWSGARAGGTELRDSLASAYVHRLRPAQARMLTGMTAADLPGDLLELPPGTAYLLDTSGDFRRVTIPQMTAADLARVAELLGGAAPSAAPSSTTPASRPIGFRPPTREVGTEVGTEVGRGEPLRPHQDAIIWTPEEAAILAALKAGKMPGEVAAALCGGRKGGDAFAQAARKVAAVIQRALGGGSLE
jgi:hypothetical protein